MKYNKLGRSSIEVSELCLGSMTWGTQNTEAEGHEQMDYALAHGINFIDTAEMYPTTPLSKETQGNTETIIGTWLANRGKRDDVVIATKISGEGYSAVRDGALIFPRTLRIAIEGSLKRLQTDYVDLYQLHWPNRGSYHFRKSWTFDATKQNREEFMADTLAILETLQELQNEGKIREVGLSNESAWGTAQFLHLSEAHGLPRMQTIQNEYSLMCRYFDLDLAELCHNEDVGLLSFSPLACGLLTGKYQNGNRPAGSRIDVSSAVLGGRLGETSQAFEAVDAYLAIANKHGLDPSQMALAFCATRPFMASAIFGATSMDQLKTAIGAADVTLSDEAMADIGLAYRKFPIPY